MKTLTIVFAMVTSSILSASSVYDHKVLDIDGNATTLKEYKGKVVLIVNVASKCGFTRQYKGLEELYSKYKEQGLVICGFPCNQFGGQEPGSEKEIKEFCSTKFGVTFPMYSKIKVKGEGIHPLYELLTGTTPFPSKELLSLGYGEMQRVITEQEPPKPSEVTPLLGPERRKIK